MTAPLLRLFVYGSLKRGFNNHNLYCRGVRSVEVAQTAGKLYRMPTGYPALVLPESRLLARGSGFAHADLETERRVETGQRMETQQRVETKGVPTATSLTSPAPWGRSRVHGELMSFADPAGRLRAIDALEEFRSGRMNRYERVLILVYSRIHQAELLAWTYVAGDLSRGRRLIPTGRWTG